MNTKCVTILLSLVLLLAGCGGGKYVEEKAVLGTVTKAMETFTSSVESAETPDAVAGLLDTFTQQVEKVIPKMKELSDAHPEWDKEPPEELKDAMDKLKSVGEKFQTEAMPKIMKMAQENADNETLQNAIQKFTGIMMQM